MSMIQVDPDDTELKEAIQAVEEATKVFNQANAAFDRNEPSMYKYSGQFDIFLETRSNMEFALQQLGRLVMDRL